MTKMSEIPSPSEGKNNVENSENESPLTTAFPMATDGSNSIKEDEWKYYWTMEIVLLIILILVITGATMFYGYKKYYLKKDPEDVAEKNDENQVELEIIA